MKRYILLFLTTCIFSSNAILFSQDQNINPSGWCTSHENYLKQLSSNPEYVKSQDELEKFTKAYTEQTLLNPEKRIQSAVKIIPVVFHVMHVYGEENIGDDQIKDQIAILNRDFRRLNTDTANTPAAFRSIAADCQIEFRLAQLDPNGNCTSGINRVYTPLTLQANDKMKALIDWPSNKYLNIWIVRTISINNTGGGYVVGYSQFPGGGAANTDGIILRADYIGSIGTAIVNNSLGRPATHEVGHWLNLRHIWGDDNGACTGSDLVDDTPNQADKNFSTCPVFPQHDSCNTTPNGVLFSDYMDYTSGNCQNVYTVGQSTRMNAALNSTVSGRNNIWSAANLLATGVSTPAQLCTADFSVNNRVVCIGTPISFKDNSWNATPTSWAWDVDNDGITDYTTQNPTHSYTTSGVYSVKLTVGDGVNTKTVTKTSHIIVLNNIAGLQGPIQEGFEDANFPYSDWYINNAMNTTAPTWTTTSTAAATGSNSLMLNNFASTLPYTMEVISPSFSLVNANQPSMTFKVAYAQRSAADDDQLQLYVTTNCGDSWSQRYSKYGVGLSTSGVLASSFTPTSASQWKLVTINLASYAESANFRYKFSFTGTGKVGNNIFLDDINLNGLDGVKEELQNKFSLNVYPNPFNQSSTVSFTTFSTYEVALGIYDLMGKEIVSISNKTKLLAGTYTLPINKSTLTSGIYFIKLVVDGYETTQKIVVQ